MADSAERPYGLDDLVAHEKGQMRLILVVLAAAIVFYALRGRTSPSHDDGGRAAAVDTSR